MLDIIMEKGWTLTKPARVQTQPETDPNKKKWKSTSLEPDLNPTHNKKCSTTRTEPQVGLDAGQSG